MTVSKRASVDWPEPVRVETHLGEVEVRDIGQGPPLVFLHLVLAEASHWDRMPPLLASRFRCVLPTLPMGAHRLPARPEADLSPAGLARAVVDIMEALDLHDVTLVGNDSGGAISQVVASDPPERLGRVVLTNCDMYDDFPPRRFRYFNLIRNIPGAIWPLGRILRIRALWPLPFVFGALANEFDADKIDRWGKALSASRAVRRDLRKVLLGFGPQVTNAAAARLRSTELPFLVAWGADDRAFRPALAERFCAEVPGAELRWVDDCKTFVCWDQPERLAELIADFVKR